MVPDHAPPAKLEAIARLGAQTIKRPFDEWWGVMCDHGAPDIPGLFIHPVSDPHVIAGNGTVALEILEDLPDVDAIVVPFGGGGQVGHRPSIDPVRQNPHHLAANPISEIGVRFVGWIVPPWPLAVLQEGPAVVPAPLEQWTNPASIPGHGTDSSRARQSRTPKQHEEHGLGLIVLMVRSQQDRRAHFLAQHVQRGIAGLARGLFEAAPRNGRNPYATREKFDAQRLRHARAGRLPRIGTGLQAMVDVQRDQAHPCAGIAPRSTRMQQRRRIPSTRQSDRHGRHLARNNKGRTRGNALCDLVDQLCRRISARRFP